MKLAKDKTKDMNMYKCLRSKLIKKLAKSQKIKILLLAYKKKKKRNPTPDSIEANKKKQRLQMKRLIRLGNSVQSAASSAQTLESHHHCLSEESFHSPAPL